MDSLAEITLGAASNIVDETTFKTDIEESLDNLKEATDRLNH